VVSPTRRTFEILNANARMNLEIKDLTSSYILEAALKEGMAIWKTPLSNFQWK
jgi:hypothetical protein